MSHEEFVRGFQEGRLQVQVDRAAGYLFTGIAVFVAALGLRFLVQASSRGFVLSRSLHDAAFYEEMRRRGILILAA